MTRARSADFLVEIGTEELPPTALRTLKDAFAASFAEALDGARLTHGAVRAFASPRRLALTVAELAERQTELETDQKGPPVSVAFDADGAPAKAALAFARKCGVEVDALERTRTDKGEWLSCRRIEQGEAAAGLLPGLVARALETLPVPRRMRWGAGEAEFVRPVHWVVMLHGKAVVDGEVLGVAAGNTTRGHRFHAPDPIRLKRPADYPDVLRARGYVVADFDARRARIVEAVRVAAEGAGGVPLGDDDLYDEVSALTEWPVALAGRFDAAYLALPQEVIVATLTAHQRYFPVANDAGELLPRFVTVANLESRDPEQVREGNERVIRPRLADADFFWNADRRSSLEARRERLGNVVYQQGLGTLLERSGRVRALAAAIAAEVGADGAVVTRAAELAKCDLLTGMVGEFPELQGIMGYHYARADGEGDDVAAAIGAQYRPRFAGDALPATLPGRVLSLADRVDALCGIFALGQKPSGNRDPFGLRRSALGIARLAVEGGLDLDLKALIAAGLDLQPAAAEPSTADDVYDFIVERMRAMYLERGDVTPEMFEAVRCRRPASLLDIDARVKAVVAFVGHDAAESLAAANKRIANILRQAEYAGGDEPDTALLDDGAERALYGSLDAASRDVVPLKRERRYTEALARLADLRQPVDAFFDDVMVMVEDEALKRNRLALLAGLRAQFLDVADISRLSIGKG